MSDVPKITLATASLRPDGETVRLTLVNKDDRIPIEFDLNVPALTLLMITTQTVATAVASAINAKRAGGQA